MLGPDSTEIATEKHSRSNHESQLPVDVTSLVIRRKSQDPGGWEQYGERGPLRHVLIHVEEKNEGGNKNDPASYTDKSGNDADNDSKSEGAYKSPVHKLS